MSDKTPSEAPPEELTREQLTARHRERWENHAARGQRGTAAREERNALIVEARTAGVTQRDTADIFGLTQGGVVNVMRAARAASLAPVPEDAPE